MNKIYKVVWSRAKHTYVVASEIAKGHTKGETTGKGLKKLAAAMLVAAALLSPSFAWAEDTVKVDKSASDTAVEVYTKEGTDKQIDAANKYTYRKAAELDKKLTDQKTSTALHVSNGNLIVGTKENQIVRNMKINGQLTSGSISTGGITSTGDVTVAGKMAADGVTDETTKDGNYIKQNNTVGNNLVSLDKQVKANDERITNVKEYLEKQTSDTYVSKTDAAVQDGAIVKKANTIGQNVAQLDAALAKETAARLGADAAQDKVIQQVNDNLVASVNTINESVKTTNENMAAGFTALSQTDAAEAAAREAKDNELNERITNEANDIHETTNKLQSDLTTETTAREAADTELNERITNEANEIHKTTNQLRSDLNTETTAREAADTALDTRITNVKEYVLSETSKNYVSKTDAVVQDGAIVKAANTIGENVANLDAALDAEKNARIWADKTQDKVIQQVNDNLVASVNNINTNMAAGFNALSQADANELAGRVAADTKLVEATNGGLSLDNDNVLQKTKTEISSTGEVKTSKEAATTLIINKKADNQVKIDSEGVTVGLNSTQMDAEGFTAGGHDYDAAGAALMSDGRIKGANGAFTVDSKGNVTSTATVKGATLTDGKATISNGNIQTNGGEINTGSGAIKTVGGDILTAGGKLSTSGGDIVAGTGDISGRDITASGVLSGDSLTVAKGMTGHSLKLTGGDLDAGAGTIKTTGKVDAGTLNVSGKATVKDLEVQGEFNAKTLSSRLDETNYTTINGGIVTSVNQKVDTDDGRTYTSSSKLTEKGRTDTAANGTTRNVSTMTAGESGSTISSLADEKQKSYITQNLKKILQGIQNGTNATTVDQTETGIKSTATDGKNTASTNLSNGGFNTYATDGTNKTYTLQTAESLTSQIGDDGKVKSVMNADGITNNADGGTITNSAKDLVNTATGNMTNTVGGKLLNDVTGDMENKVGGTLTETVTGDVTEDYKANLSTTVGGNQTTTVTGDSSLSAENINNEAKNRITNKALDVETDAKSSIVNKVSNEYGSNTSTQLSYETKEEMSQADGKTASYLRGAAEEKSQLTDGAKKTTIDTVAGQTNTNITEGKNISNNLQKADQVASSVTDGTNSTVVDQKAGSIASSITDGKKANNTSSTVDKSEQLIKASDTQYSATTKTAAKMEDALVSGSSVIDVIKSLDDAANPVISSAVTDGTNTTGSTMTAKGITNSAAESIVNEIGDGSKVKSEMTAKGITNTAKDGTITNDAKDVLNKGTNSVINEVGNNQVAVKTDSVKAAYGSDTYTTWDASGITSATSGDMKNSAKNISNTAAEKLSNSAAEIENTASKSITDKVGENTSWKMTDGTVVESVEDESGKTNQTTTTAADTYQFVKDGDNTLAKRTSSTNDNLNITDGTNTYTKITTATGNKETVTDGTETASTNLTKSASNTLIENGTQSVLNHVAADTSYTVMNEKGNGSRRQQSASEILDRVTDGTDTSEVKQTASEVATSAKDITNTADTIKDVAGKTTVTTTDTGTTFENTAHSTAIEEGTITNTTISGNTLETGKATMDYAEVMKDLGVRGSTTLGTTANDKLTVNATSTFNENVSIKKDLSVGGTTTTDKLVVNNGATIAGGATVTGGTTTDKLHVTSTSQFDGAATFKDVVTMEKDLNVGGNAKVAGDVTAKSFKVGENTYIDENGINANNKVIKNVGQGDISEGSHDAVSGGQLYETNTRVSGLETRMGSVETRVDKLDNKIDKVGANAAAMANLHPLEFDEDSKWNIAAAVGSSGSETASAVGVFYRPNENVMVNASAAMGTGENMFGGGVSLRLGHGSNKAKDAQMKAAAKENRELRAKVDDLTARMDALLSVLNPNMSKDFPDVPENHWAYEAVSRLAGNGIVEGYEDGKYHGERQMTRYEMAEIIYNALSKGAKAEKKLVEEFRPELQAMAAQKKA